MEATGKMSIVLRKRIFWKTILMNFPALNIFLPEAIAHYIHEDIAFSVKHFVLENLTMHRAVSDYLSDLRGPT